MGVSTLHKKGPRYLCKNWRPISLLNCDYKVAPRAISMRLRHGIGRIISPDQTCCIPRRYIGENICVTADLINLADKENFQLADLSLLREKPGKKTGNQLKKNS